MENKIQCPSCPKSFRIIPSQVGKKSRCSHCGQVFKIPDIFTDDESADYDSILERTVPIVDANVVQVKTKTKRKTSSVIAFLMLGVTILFPVSVVAMMVVGSIGIAQEQKREQANSTNIMGSSIVATENGLFEYKSASRKKAERAGSLIGLVIGSLCFPGVPYAFSMLLLGVAYFAFKSSGN